MQSSTPLQAPQILLNDIVPLKVRFFDFEKKEKRGVIEIHTRIQKDIQELFQLIYKLKFPLCSVKLISDFNFSDDLSMRANNTSAFNFRTVSMDSSRISNHGYGVALDINPVQNPYIKNDVVLPRQGIYNLEKPGTLHPNHPIVLFMKQRGFIWGGDWNKPYVDYQHFEKPLPNELQERYLIDFKKIKK